MRLHRVATLTFALAATSAPALAQPDNGHMTGAGAAPSVSANGQLQMSIPIALPPARGGVPTPLTLAYSGSTRVGEIGVGWGLSVPHVRRSTSTLGTRPQFSNDPDAQPLPVDRLYLSFGGRTMVMVAESPGVYRPMLGPATLTLIDLNEGWLLHDGAGNRYTFHALPSLERDDLWVLDEVNDAKGKNPVRYYWYVFEVDVGNGQTGHELSLHSIELNPHPAAGCPKHRVDFYWAYPYAEQKLLSASATMTRWAIQPWCPTGLRRRVGSLVRSRGIS